MSWEQSFITALARAAEAAGVSFAHPASTDLFSPEYRSLIPPELAVRDALSLNALARDGGERYDLWEPHPELRDGCYRLQIYGEQERSLDQIMPFLDNLNLRVIDQVPFRPAMGSRHWFIRSFSVVPRIPVDDLMARKAPLLEALRAPLAGWVANDMLNGLVVMTDLDWREIDVFRAYRNYYFQLGGSFGRFRFHLALLSNPGIADLLFRYFRNRFDPDAGWPGPDQREEEGLSPLRVELAAALDAVTDVNEDRILRDLFNLIDATLRTDFYRPKPPAEHAVALKISSLGVINMPSPRPLFEIYVHSPLMEGIHLRGAKVARGGIRWSDRPDDFRSEVLDLMQTQMTKNALIVPLGAKGGFVLNTTCTDPKERYGLAVRAYGTLIRGLLNLTDNLVGQRVEPPPGVVAYDDADPYLVVAADKGTAGLSDTANAIAGEYGFWLGDAFASGGSKGYHHKGLGITARGAWVCVRRHFHEAGQDIDTQPFTVVGIGSMDGDVFGNGMLLSQNIRLLAAFGPGQIFLDPDPDPVASHRERQRLFELPGSSWNDYDRGLISPGGGVFPRSAKDLPLSPEVRAWLGVRRTSMDGEGLIRLLLAAPVDLLWLGGIGTYVKATTETHEEVADRANDPVRIDASQLRAKIVGEGANLGFTQKARVEYALAGGRIDTDAVDNSAGVDMSDHEVNLKIFMALLQSRGAIGDEDERDQYLRELTDEVVAQVLADNRGQSLCLSLDQMRCRRDVYAFVDVADRLVNAGLLDPVVESFPTRNEILARGSAGLTRPELAVLMAYAKLALKRALLESAGFLSELWNFKILGAYFPISFRERFGDLLPEHSLAREITATRICNAIIGRAGIGFLGWVDELEPAQLVRAVETYVFFDRIIGGQALHAQLSSREGEQAASCLYEAQLQIEDLLADFCRWALQGHTVPLPDDTRVDAWRADFGAFVDHLSATPAWSVGHEQRLAAGTALGLDSEGARILAFRERLREFPALCELAERNGEPLATVVRTGGRIAEILNLGHWTGLLEAVVPRDRWERRSRTALLERFRSAPAHLAGALLRTGTGTPEAWFAAPEIQAHLSRFRRLEHELTESAATALIPFVALVAALEALREAAEEYGRQPALLHHP